ncbi:hypothetical protein Tco_1327081 [Tanacetum coccineum]
MNDLNELRDQAYENSLIYKEKTKKIHDSKIKNRFFNVGDRVLLFNSRLKIFLGKLKTRWTGPFTVAQVFLMEPSSYLKTTNQISRIAWILKTPFAASGQFAADVAAFKKVEEIIEVEIRLLALVG